MTRTLVVTNDFPPRVGGIESFVLALVRRLPPDQVVVHTARQPGDAAYDAGLPFPVVRDPARLLVPTPAIGRRTVATARDLGCESVWFGAAAPLGLLARRLRDDAGVRRLVGSTHGHEVWWARTPGTRRALRRIGETTDVLTYVAGYTRDRVAAALSAAAAARMVPLRPGVDVDVFHPGVDGGAVRERYGLQDRPVVVCVSRLVARKGQDTLVRALPLLHRRVPDAALLLVGDGPARATVQRLATELGVARDVVLAGPHPWHELPPFFAAGDVFAMPTRSRRGGLEVEAFGIVYLEAAACGLPVVVGDSGGAPDTVVEGETGHVVDGRSPAEVADRLADLLLDPARAARMGAAGRTRVERELTWDLAAERLGSVLRA